MPLPAVTAFSRRDVIDEKLYVMTSIFNSARYRSRWRLYEDFKHMVESSRDADLYTVEVAFGERAFVIPDGPDILRLRTSHELWLKERALNLLAARVLQDHPHAKYFAVVDADVSFAKGDWVNDTLHALQHYEVVQMWSKAFDLDPHGEIISEHQSFMDHYIAGGTPVAVEGGYYDGGGTKYPGSKWHPGYAWGWRRSAWDMVGGLYDTAILGSADSYMAWGLIGKVQDILNAKFSPGYKQSVFDWQQRADWLLKRNVGRVKGSLFHHWHGPKVKRRYVNRNEILIRTQYDPCRDLVPDAQGLWQINHEIWNDRIRSINIRDMIRNYFHERDEDSTCTLNHSN